MKNIFTQNTKMKKSSTKDITIYNFGISAVKSCPYAGDCKVGCYANTGCYRFGNVKSVFDSRLELTKQKNFTDVVYPQLRELLNKATKRNKSLMIRLHDSGDFYSKEYLMKWIRIMELFPTIKFYAYTKSIPFFKGIRIPKNFKVVFSFGGTKDHMIDTKRHWHAKVFTSLAELNNAGYVDGSHDDKIAALHSTKKIGLVYHGAASKEFNTK